MFQGSHVLCTIICLVLHNYFLQQCITHLVIPRTFFYISCQDGISLYFLASYQTVLCLLENQDVILYSLIHVLVGDGLRQAEMGKP